MKKAKIPILFEGKEDCCGCSACYAICPKEAIIMEADEEGFEYPRIKEEKCIQCGRCLTVCPVKVSRNPSPWTLTNRGVGVKGFIL